MEDNETWDLINNKYIKIPEDMLSFIKDIIEVMKKHNLTISHEDGHGAFIIEKYDDYNIKWLKDALKNY